MLRTFLGMLFIVNVGIASVCCVLGLFMMLLGQWQVGLVALAMGVGSLLSASACSRISGSYYSEGDWNEQQSD